MEYADIVKILSDLIPKEEMESKSSQLLEFCSGFMGFVDVYYHLSQVIPKDYTVIDFGAGWNAQSYFFLGHKRYIAINPRGEEGDDAMFCPPNCEIYRMTTLEFLRDCEYPKRKVFAICSYVPNWYDQDSIDLVRRYFRNVFTFYP